MKQLLSIQSAVAAGFVGNSVAGPVLTALGQHPLLVDTILLAAHPGYGRRAGGAVPAAILGDVLDGLATLTELSAIGTVISGYLGNADQIDAIAGFIDGWKQSSGQSAADAARRYILDPVLGDGGRLYVAPDLAEAMITELLPRADIITPN
ncbi:MAG TPA: pyridoxal kinase PdxY, partial [Alphaproteobacteria bacterium]|nr:pyridoxal kinase PdxY [Alphaproteobacteria bacterium]